LHSPHKSCLLLISSIKTAGESSINIAKRSSEKMDLSMIITSLKKMVKDTNYKNFLLSSLGKLDFSMIILALFSYGITTIE